MANRTLYRLCLPPVLMLLFAVPIAAQTSDRPNILFILLDDLGWKDAGYAGSDFYQTPNIDQLAATGMIFTDAYSAAANCAPARACLLSGQYTPRHQIYNVGTKLRGNPKFSRLKHVPGTKTLDPKIITWAERIQKANYKTAIMGKWHLSDDPLPYGFDINIGGTHAGSPPKGYFPPNKVPGLKDSPKGEYLTDRLHDEALDFIEENRSQPWCLFLSHFSVHTPLQAKRQLVEKFDRLPKGTHQRSAVMAAMIQSVDEGVGRLVKKLDELQLREKTAIVFYSDNGGYGPATSMHPLRGSKGSYYEGGIRVPFFVVWPGVVKAESKCQIPVTGVDFYLTLCDIAQAEPPEGQVCDGVSLLPLIKDTGNWQPRSIFWHFPAYLQSYSGAKANIERQRDPLFRSRPVSVIRDGDWKLMEFFEDGTLELYNLSDDIGESKNLADSNPQKLAELHEKLKLWRAKTKAPIPTEPNPRFDATAEAKAILRAK